MATTPRPLLAPRALRSAPHALRPAISPAPVDPADAPAELAPHLDVSLPIHAPLGTVSNHSLLQ